MFEGFIKAYDKYCNYLDTLPASILRKGLNGVEVIPENEFANQDTPQNMI